MLCPFYHVGNRREVYALYGYNRKQKRYETSLDYKFKMSSRISQQLKNLCFTIKQQLVYWLSDFLVIARCDSFDCYKIDILIFRGKKEIEEDMKSLTAKYEGLEEKRRNIKK